jgi:hypothetical protein
MGAGWYLTQQTWQGEVAVTAWDGSVPKNSVGQDVLIFYANRLGALSELFAGFFAERTVGTAIVPYMQMGMSLLCLIL